MERFRGYAVQSEPVRIGGRVYEVLAPTDSDALLDDPRVAGRFEQDEYMPYWAMLWPGAMILAEAVAEWPTVPTSERPPEVLELGCGLGLAGLVAAGLGYRVTLSDYDEDALAFAQENARRNALPIPIVRVVDWRETYEDLRPNRIIAADVLYEPRNLAPVAAFITRHLQAAGFALVSDPNRSTADPFADIARASGLDVSVTQVERRGVEQGIPISGRVYHLQHRRAPVA